MAGLPYIRKYLIRVLTPVSRTSGTSGTQTLLDVTEHQIQARITFSNKSGGAAATAQTIRIYNATKEAQRIFNTKNARIELRAGYLYEQAAFTPDRLPLIFRGEIVTATTVRGNSEVITELVCSDAYTPKSGAFYAKTHKKGTSVATILEEVCKTFALEYNVDLGDKSEIKLDSNVPYNNTSVETLTLICKEFGLVWYIQNDKIFVTNNAQPSKIGKDGIAAIPNSRIKGTVSLATDSSTAGEGVSQSVVDFTMILYAGLDLGSLVEVIIDQMPAVFVVESLVYDLDYFRDNWHVKVTGSDKTNRRRVPAEATQDISNIA